MYFEPKTKAATRRYVIERANGCCEYCMSPQNYSEAYFAVEHIIPKVFDGKDDIDNLAFSCLGCNWHKAVKTVAIDPLSKETVALFNPRAQAWTSHFAWSEDFTEMIGHTPCGRATIIALKMNREFLKNQRLAFAKLKIHPPKHSLITA